MLLTALVVIIVGFCLLNIFLSMTDGDDEYTIDFFNDNSTIAPNMEVSLNNNILKGVLLYCNRPLPKDDIKSVTMIKTEVVSTSGLWNQNVKQRLHIQIDVVKGFTRTQKVVIVEYDTKKPRPAYPTAPYDLTASRVWREKYHGTCQYVTWDVKKGEKLPVKVEFGHHWRFYPERTTYATWDGSRYYTTTGYIDLIW